MHPDPGAGAERPAPPHGCGAHVLEGALWIAVSSVTMPRSVVDTAVFRRRHCGRDACQRSALGCRDAMRRRAKGVFRLLNKASAYTRAACRGGRLPITTARVLAGSCALLF